MDVGQRREAERRAAPSAAVVHEAVRADGEDNLRRGTVALASSALAAGLSMGFSFFVPGLIQSYVPDTSWRPLLTALGYPIGFLLVILGRQQLFTQNTLTVVLPLLERRDMETVGRVARVWGVVLGANLCGALAVAWVAGHTPLFEPDILRTLTAIGQEAVATDRSAMLVRAMFAGWLIALIVWLLPFAETARVWVIFAITYVVALEGFPQIVTTAVTGFYLTTMGSVDWGVALTSLLFPTMIGNIAGGVLLVAVLNHAQVAADSRNTR